MTSYQDREIDADRLVKILLDLPDGATVYPNSVGDLIVNDADFDMLGHIDFDEKRFVSVEED